MRNHAQDDPHTSHSATLAEPKHRKSHLDNSPAKTDHLKLERCVQGRGCVGVGSSYLYSVWERRIGF